MGLSENAKFVQCRKNAPFKVEGLEKRSVFIYMSIAKPFNLERAPF